MIKNRLTLLSFLESFRVLQHQPVWRVIHPADGILHISLGRKYANTISGLHGEQIPYDKGEFQLHLYGPWELWMNGALVETSAVRGDTKPAYFDRMQKLEDDFPIQRIESVSWAGNMLELAGNGAVLKMPVLETEDSVSLTHAELDANNTLAGLTHYRFDADVHSLARLSWHR